MALTEPSCPTKIFLFFTAQASASRFEELKIKIRNCHNCLQRMLSSTFSNNVVFRLKIVKESLRIESESLLQWWPGVEMRGCQDCSPGTCFYDWYIWCWWHDVSVTVQDDDVDVEDDDVVCNEVICTDPSTLSTIIWFWLSWAVMRQESVSRACSGHLQSKLQTIRVDKISRELLLLFSARDARHLIK